MSDRIPTSDEHISFLEDQLKRARNTIIALTPPHSSEISLLELNKMDMCRHLLPNPGPEVTGNLISEIRRLRALPNYWLEQHGIENEKRGEAEAALGQAEELIERIRKVVTGEDQVADTDTEGMACIAKEIAKYVQNSKGQR
jgi:hypothetical protein